MEKPCTTPRARCAAYGGRIMPSHQYDGGQHAVAGASSRVPRLPIGGASSSDHQTLGDSVQSEHPQGAGSLMGGPVTRIRMAQSSQPLRPVYSGEQPPTAPPVSLLQPGKNFVPTPSRSGGFGTGGAPVAAPAWLQGSVAEGLGSFQQSFNEVIQKLQQPCYAGDRGGATNCGGSGCGGRQPRRSIGEISFADRVADETNYTATASSSYEAIECTSFCRPRAASGYGRSSATVMVQGPLSADAPGSRASLNCRPSRDISFSSGGVGPAWLATGQPKAPECGEYPDHSYLRSPAGGGTSWFDISDPPVVQHDVPPLALGVSSDGLENLCRANDGLHSWKDHYWPVRDEHDEVGSATTPRRGKGFGGGTTPRRGGA